MFTEPFHEGERSVQRRAGQEEFARRNSAMLRDRIHESFLPFLRAQTMLVVSSADPQGALWSSLLFGAPGFLSSADGSSLSIGPYSNSLLTDVRQGTRLGLLAIDLRTRRRLRINGTISLADADHIELRVEESYPNCPKYIVPRALCLDKPTDGSIRTSGTELRAVQARTVTAADLLFIASEHPVRGLDASHRGGEPGFVELLDSRTLRIPDYQGNSMFNTLGNLSIYPRAGLAIPDFERGSSLHLTGQAEIVWNRTERHLIYHVDRWRELPFSEQRNRRTQPKMES